MAGDPAADVSSAVSVPDLDIVIATTPGCAHWQSPPTSVPSPAELADEGSNSLAGSPEKAPAFVVCAQLPSDCRVHRFVPICTDPPDVEPLRATV